MVKVEWVSDWNADTPVFYPYSNPPCVNWGKSQFKEYFIKKLMKKLSEYNLELRYIRYVQHPKYAYSGPTVTRFRIEYSIIVTVTDETSRKADVRIHSKTINIAKLNREEAVKYLCMLNNKIINDIVMLARAGLVLYTNNDKIPKIRVADFEFVSGGEKVKDFTLTVDAGYFTVHFNKPHYLNTIKLNGKEPDIMIAIKNDGNLSNVIKRMVAFFRVVDWDYLDSIIKLSKRVNMSPEKIIEKVINTLTLILSEIQKGNAIVTSDKLSILMYSDVGYDSQNKWKEEFNVMTNVKINKYPVKKVNFGGELIPLTEFTV